MSFENPPPEQLDDQEWSMIPDEDGNLYMVNTAEALSEPQQPFVAHTGVIFELYTLDNPTNAQILHTGNAQELAASNFNPARPTRFVVHGWNSRGGLTTIFQNAYFEQGKNDINLIAVNWQAKAVTINYIGARNRVPRVGQHVARFVDFLCITGGADVKSINLIGHSLGGHVVGIAGKHVSVGKLPLIVALDPANPLFSYRRHEERVAVGDAENVQIIHTAAGSLGFSAPLGDASFYPNGGRSQPGCGLDMAGSCAHSRATDLFAESINTDVGFYSLSCASYDEIRRGRCTEQGVIVRMGEYS